MSWLKEILQRKAQIETQERAAAETAHKKYWAEKREKWKNHVADAERALGWWRFLELDLVLKDVAQSGVLRGGKLKSLLLFKNDGSEGDHAHSLDTYDLLHVSSEKITKYLESYWRTPERVRFSSLNSEIYHTEDITHFKGGYDNDSVDVPDLIISLTPRRLLADDHILGNLNEFRGGRPDVESKLKDYLMDKLHLR